ncbi:efflux RND transporter periplasmic adaptor subunit [Methylocystis parvus]|uniref:Efflux RND transporter periplasmic adaptor subunit n=1 Tax=Methylocystis parvus TaxID=134 RepID=A0A6B8M778_9HYPH|nr:efflux RND transporter periplasmic adaptor subunit [Methylocystis parvus]QGM98358.1 efflux RND transporter periplasmic adaptor subunit [Methylocystis parvus]WBK01314.1 efflux RND transporter periplasmic adaptor subunit [Methylocystis parvus OBBP]
MRHHHLLPLILTLACVCGLPASGAPPNGQAANQDILVKLTEEQIHAAGVETQPVEAESGVGEIVVPGVVSVPPQQLRIVAAPAAGLVETLLVAPDEDVKEGDPIATLKSSELVEAQRAFLLAMSEAALAVEKLRRDEQLFKERIIAERRLIVTRAEAAQARATLDERAQILALAGMTEPEIAALRKDRKLAAVLMVRAPLGGTILQRHGTTGERVAASAPLVTIARLDPIWVNLQVPLGRAVALDSVERVHLPSAGLDGKLIRVGRTVDSATQSVTAVAEFRPGRSPLRPGQALTAILRVKGGGSSQWRVPADAVVSHLNHSWVFVRVPEGFRAIPVTLVSETPQFASVQGPLAVGERVATRGLLTLLAELAEAESK